MESARQVVIVGGGISGLAAAHALMTTAIAKKKSIGVTLIERRPGLGGNISTEKRDGFTLDGGPDSWVANKPQATALARALGLSSSLASTIEATRRVYVAHEGALHPMPEGLVLGVPTRMLPMVTTKLFSWAAKLRMGMEPLVPRRVTDEDESIGDFIERRLGREVCERLAAPLLGGIFAGDAAALSIRATFPQFVEMEKRYGSLVVGMRAQAAAAAKLANKGGEKPSAFVSLRGGMGALIEALAKALEAGGVAIYRGVTAKGIGRLPDGDARGMYAVELEGREPLFAHDVVLAGPTHVAARALESLDGALSSALAGIRYASTATAFLAFRRKDIAHPLDAVGFLVPRPQGRPILAATWVSSKWENRAPADHVLMRVFFGGACGEEILARDDAALAAVGMGELEALMGLRAKPLFTRVFRFDRASPQPVVGHLDRVAKIRRMLTKWPGIHAIGSGFEGVGIPDCVRQATSAAEALLARE